MERDSQPVGPTSSEGAQPTSISAVQHDGEANLVSIPFFSLQIFNLNVLEFKKNKPRISRLSDMQGISDQEGRGVKGEFWGSFQEI